jgi:hypothetical protein
VIGQQERASRRIHIWLGLLSYQNFHVAPMYANPRVARHNFPAASDLELDSTSVLILQGFMSPSSSS